MKLTIFFECEGNRQYVISNRKSEDLCQARENKVRRKYENLIVTSCNTFKLKNDVNEKIQKLLIKMLHSLFKEP